MMTAFTSRHSKTIHCQITLTRLSNQYSRWVEKKINSELWPPLTNCEEVFLAFVGGGLAVAPPPLISPRSESPNKLFSENLAFMLFIWYLGKYDTNDSVCSTCIIVHAYVIIVVLIFFNVSVIFTLSFFLPCTSGSSYFGHFLIYKQNDK